MCKAMEGMRNQAAYERTQTVARRMLADGTLALEKIADYVGLSLEEVKKLQIEQSM